MDKRDFTVLGLRLLAIYAWLEACAYLAGGSMGMIFQATHNQGQLSIAIVVASLFPTILFLVIGCFLFRLSQRFADYLLAGTSSGDSHLVPDSRNLAVIAFGAVGLIAFFMALPRAVELIVRWLHILEDNTPFAITDTFRADCGRIVGTALQFVLSFALIIKARKFTEWWWHRQNLQP